jgi:CHAT domain-containing protein
VGIAWGFVAAGAQRVVATRWPIDDAASARVFLALHRLVAAGVPPATALRDVQQALRAAGEPPAVWLAPVVVGAL